MEDDLGNITYRINLDYTEEFIYAMKNWQKWDYSFFRNVPETMEKKISKRKRVDYDKLFFYIRQEKYI